MYHQTLKSQLKKLNLDSTSPPHQKNWIAFLREINQAYTQTDQEKTLLEQSLNISSTEIQKLYETRLHKVITKLVDQRDNLESIFNNLPEAIITFDGDGQFITLNPAAEKLFGYSQQELIGQSLNTVINFTSEQFNINSIQPTFDEESVIKHVNGLTGIHKDQHQFSLEISLNPMTGDPTPIYTAIARDMTVTTPIHEGYNKKLQEALLLNHIIATITSNLETQTILNTICQEIVKNLGYPHAAIALLHETEAQLTVTAEYNGPKTRCGHHHPSS